MKLIAHCLTTNALVNIVCGGALLYFAVTLLIPILWHVGISGAP